MKRLTCFSPHYSTIAVATKADAGPDDITRFGNEMNFNKQFEKLKTLKFPKSGSGNEKRCFQLQWIHRYSWIEYSQSRDAVFCYICRQFGEHSQEQTFTTIGFNKWRVALTENKGFGKHNGSTGHIAAAARYAEKMKRTETGKSISELLSSSVLEKCRHYCRKIVEVILFLVSNRLALRGEWDDEEKEEGGLFNNLFEFTLKNNAELQVAQQQMPLNATYKSPQIQNEMIETLAHMLRKNIVNEVQSKDQLADVFTKPLAKPAFDSNVMGLGMN